MIPPSERRGSRRAEACELGVTGQRLRRALPPRPAPATFRADLFRELLAAAVRDIDRTTATIRRSRLRPDQHLLG